MYISLWNTKQNPKWTTDRQKHSPEGTHTFDMTTTFAIRQPNFCCSSYTRSSHIWWNEQEVISFYRLKWYLKESTFINLLYLIIISLLFSCTDFRVDKDFRVDIKVKTYTHKPYYFFPIEETKAKSELVSASNVKRL